MVPAAAAHEHQHDRADRNVQARAGQPGGSVREAGPVDSGHTWGPQVDITKQTLGQFAYSKASSKMSPSKGLGNGEPTTSPHVESRPLEETKSSGQSSDKFSSNRSVVEYGGTSFYEYELVFESYHVAKVFCLQTIRASLDASGEKRMDIVDQGLLNFITDDIWDREILKEGYDLEQFTCDFVDLDNEDQDDSSSTSFDSDLRDSPQKTPERSHSSEQGVAASNQDHTVSFDAIEGTGSGAGAALSLGLPEYAALSSSSAGNISNASSPAQESSGRDSCLHETLSEDIHIDQGSFVIGDIAINRQPH